MNPSTGFLLACDPGLRATGVALFKDVGSGGYALVRATALRGPAKGNGPAVWNELAGLVYGWTARRLEGIDPALFIDRVPGTLVIETMRHAPGRSVPVEDLLELAGVAGAIVGRLSSWSSHAALAHRWKSQVPRDVMGARVEEHLRREGLWHLVDVPSRATELNDAMHAVGLGRWWLSR
jgi:hypothetical protein